MPRRPRDIATGTPGAKVRPIGEVPDAMPLTRYESGKPYLVKEYDLNDTRG